MKYKVKQTINKNALSADRHIFDGVDVKNNELFISFIDQVSMHQFDYKFCIKFGWCEKVDLEWRMMPCSGYPNYSIEANINPDIEIFDDIEID